MATDHQSAGAAPTEITTPVQQHVAQGKCNRDVINQFCNHECRHRYPGGDQAAMAFLRWRNRCAKPVKAIDAMSSELIGHTPFVLVQYTQPALQMMGGRCKHCRRNHLRGCEQHPALRPGRTPCTREPACALCRNDLISCDAAALKQSDAHRQAVDGGCRCSTSSRSRRCRRTPSQRIRGTPDCAASAIEIHPGSAVESCISMGCQMPTAMA